MKHIIVWTCILSVITALSPMVVMPSSVKYQTGRTFPVLTAAQKVGNTAVVLNIPFVSAAPTSSLNCSLGIVSNHFTLKNGLFGWSLVISSITTSYLQITISTGSNTNFISLLQVCYLVSWQPNLNVNYVYMPLNPATDILANNSLPAPAMNPPSSITNSRFQTFSNIMFDLINNSNKITLYIAGFLVSSMGGTSDPFGFILNVVTLNNNNFTLNVTIYSQAQLSQFSFFHITYAKGLFVTPFFMYEGSARVGCVYTNAGCPWSSTNSWSTIGQVFNFYSPQLFFMGISSFIGITGGSANGDFDITSFSLSGGGAYTFGFNYAAGNNSFTIQYNYMFLLAAFCPTTGDIYQVYNSSTFCDISCNNGFLQYPDANRVCQLCDVRCFACNGPTNTSCSLCYNLQNRILSGSQCICDPNGFYDDGTSNICLQCNYICLGCTGPTAGQCSSCDPLQFRTLVGGNSCPCNAGYYDGGQQTCKKCYYTCLTCTGSLSTNCLTCDTTKLRQYFSNGTCSCQVGYYDNNTNSSTCSPCHYSCLTCLGTNVNCTSCNFTNFRAPIGNTCPCIGGYFDNNIGLCVICHPTCLTCNGPLQTNCITCDALAKRAIQINTCPCFTGYYSFSNICYLCHYSCLNCTDGTATGCVNCNTTLTSRVYDSATHQCLCIAGHFDSGINVCPLCQYTCLTCSITSITCVTCKTIFYRTLIGTTCPCNTGYVDVLLTGLCTACHYSCASCISGTGSTQCTSCPATSLRILSANPGTCLCPVGTYDDGIHSLCQLCDPHCVSCIDMYFTSCTSCLSTNQRSLVLPTVTSPSGSCMCIAAYYDSGLLLCSSCSPLCLTCLGTASNCTSCDSTTNHRVITTLNQCICQNGYYQVGAAACPACTSPCSTCSLLPNNCTSCYSDRTLVSNVCACNSGTFQNTLGICQICQYTCSTCVNASTTCTSCPLNSFRTQSGTTCPCSIGYYDNGVVVCPACSYRCLSCTSSSICTSCPLSTFRTLQTNFTCICNPGYYDDGANPICKMCSPLCVTCQSYSQCLSCDSTLFRVWDSVSLLCSCINGYFDNGICTPCHYSCASCFGGTSSSCFACNALRTFTVPNSCPCSTGFYEVSGICSSCSLSCLTCSITPTNCTSCNVGSFLSNYQCFCNAGYYLNGILCSACDSTCQTCSITSTSCLTCNITRNTVLNGSSCQCSDGTYASATNICLSCNQICLTCTANSTSSCLSCTTGLMRVFTGGLCLCIPGYYEAGMLSCQPCNSVCVTCNGPTSLNCTSCATNFTLIGSSCMPTIICTNYYYQGNCINICPSTTYPFGNICLNCINNCQTCSNTIVCLTCMPGSYYLSSNQSCLSVCPISTYSFNNTCMACPSGCSLCSMRLTQLLCSSCITGYYLFQQGCTNICPTAALTHVILAPYCLPCIDSCLTCTSLHSGDCLSCQVNFSLFSGMCLSQCPEGYTSINQICNLCPASCLKCTSNQCVQCAPGYYLTNHECLQMGYFLQAGIPIKCHYNCMTCTNSSFSSCITCNRYRGDAGQLAISGYCDCWKGSIDLGNGNCDRETYRKINQLNKALISMTTSVNYFSFIGGTAIFNFMTPVMLITYQQLYSNFYYVNSSSVMQTDWVLNDYSKTNPNTFIKSLPKKNDPFVRLLTYQSDQSLYMRGSQYEYLCEWAIFIQLLFGVIVILIFITDRINKYYESPNKIKNIDSNSQKKKSTLSQAAKLMGKVLNQRIIFIIFLLTVTQISLYATAFFKIIAVQKPSINAFKLLLSVCFALFYIIYIIRIIVISVKQNQQKNQLQKLLISGFTKKASKSALSRLYIPILIIRNLFITFCLVVSSSNGSTQTVVGLCIYLIASIYSFCCCPYNKIIRVFIHLHECLFIVQLIILMVSTTMPEDSRINNAMFLLFFNYAQTVLFLIMSVFLLITNFFPNLCQVNKIQNEAAAEENQKVQTNNHKQPVIFDQPNVDRTEQNISDVLMNEQLDNSRGISQQQSKGSKINSLCEVQYPTESQSYLDMPEAIYSTKNKNTIKTQGKKPAESDADQVIRKRYRKKAKKQLQQNI